MIPLGCLILGILLISTNVYSLPSSQTYLIINELGLNQRKGNHMEPVYSQKRDEVSPHLHITPLVFKDAPSFQSIRKAVIEAKLNRIPILLELDNSLSPQASFSTILPMCNLIIGSINAFKHLSGLSDSLPALRYFRQKTDATFAIYMDNNECQIIDGDLPHSLTPKAASMEDKHRLVGQFTKTYFFIPRTLQITS